MEDEPTEIPDERGQLNEPPLGAWPKDEVAAAGERETLIAFLGHQRRFLERKATGISDEQARTQSCPPSDLTLLGLVCHLTDVERGWAQRGSPGDPSHRTTTRMTTPMGTSTRLLT